MLFSGELVVGALVCVAAGAVGGWWLHRLGEQSRKAAHDAHCREVAQAAGRARDRFQSELRQALDRLQSLRDEHAACANRITTLRRELGGNTTRFEESQGEIDTMRSSFHELERQLADREASLQTALKQKEQIVTDLELALRESAPPPEAPDWLMHTPDGAKDDLTAIRGLGPVLERRLNDLGVYHFRQIAHLTGQETDWVATRIRTSKNRIIREDWATQARQLLHRDRR